MALVDTPNPTGQPVPSDLRFSLPPADRMGGRAAPKPSLGTLTTASGRTVNLDDLLVKWKANETAARNDRRRYEAAWHLATAFVAGRQWVGWDQRTRRVVLEPNPKRRERHTVNVLTRYFWAQIGRVYGEEFKPDLWFARNDQMSEDFVSQARRAYDFAWDEELEAEQVLFDLTLETFAYGTAAVRVAYNPNHKHLGTLPQNREGTGPEYDLEKARALVGERKYYGEDPQLSPVWEGRVEWEVLSPLNLLPPPGMPYSRKFPWIIVDSLMTIDDAQLRYGDAAANLSEESLAAVDILGLRDLGSQSDDPGAATGTGRLRNMVVVRCAYQRPTPDFPKGMTLEWAQDKILDVKDELPHNVNGEYKAGITFFHYNRLPRRFWSQGVVEPGIGPQRQRNRSRSQQIEMKDKNLGRVYAWKGTITENNRPTGKIMELIEVSRSAPGLPQETAGVPPGEWIAAETAQNDADLDKVMGASDVSMGQAPRGVSAYSAFALLAEQDDRRVGPVLKGMRTSMVELSQVTMSCIRRYWPEEKQIVLAGIEDEDESFAFNASKLPEAIYFRWSTGGPPTPKSPAAQIQLVFDLFDRSISSGKPLPLDWLYNSLKQGKPLPLPDADAQAQQRLAELENQLANEGHQLEVHPSDDGGVHIPIHQEALSALALIPGAEQVIANLQQHIQQHEAQSAQAQAAATSVPGMQGPMGALGAPGAAPPPGAGAGAQPQLSDLLEEYRSLSHGNNLSPLMLGQ